MSERDRSGDHVTTVIPMEYARVNGSASRARPPAHTYREVESSGHVVTPPDSTPKTDGNEWSPPEAPPETSGHTLYRFFNAAGDLLYIGLTNDPGRRLQKPRRAARRTGMSPFDDDEFREMCQRIEIRALCNEIMRLLRDNHEIWLRNQQLDWYVPRVAIVDAIVARRGLG
jgi:hypothetical protein